MLIRTLTEPLGRRKNEVLDTMAARGYKRIVSGIRTFRNDPDQDLCTMDMPCHLWYH